MSSLSTHQVSDVLDSIEVETVLSRRQNIDRAVEQENLDDLVDRTDLLAHSSADFKPSTKC